MYGGRICHPNNVWTSVAPFKASTVAIRKATRVRTILNVTSRTELDTDPAATQRWFSLVKDFEAWEKGRR